MKRQTEIAILDTSPMQIEYVGSQNQLESSKCVSDAGSQDNED